MKILQLNAWTGRIKGTLKDFFSNSDFDIACLQEAVWSDNLLLENFCVTADQIKEIGSFNYDFRSANWNVQAFNSTVEQGNVIFSKKRIVNATSEIVHGNYQSLNSIDNIRNQGYSLQIVTLENSLNIINHHGYWLPTPVGDKTTVQIMKKVASIIKKLQGPIIMCGDLNIVHESPAMRELDFLRDLTDEYKIDNTLVGLKFNGKVACDHILVSEDVSVKSFKLLDNLVSDHRALAVEIEL